MDDKREFFEEYEQKNELKKRPVVVLVGRTNVGKSSLWNLLTETNQALVSQNPHTTRDRKFGTVVWQGSEFDLIDTGGMDVEHDDIGSSVKRQAETATRQADLVLFVVDVQTSALEIDRQLAKQTQKLNRHILLLVNKTDQPRLESLAYQPEFFQFGFGKPFPVSANTHFGIGELLDTILYELSVRGIKAVPVQETPSLRVAIIGRSNAGKSSLLNAILGEERVIVSPAPHTTREPQHTEIFYAGQTITLIDTAGLRFQTRAMSELEEEALERNKEAMKIADVCLLVIDATVNPTAQDRRLAGQVAKSVAGLVLVVNKWDAIPNKTTQTTNEYELLFRQAFPFLSWALIATVSAKTRQRTRTLLDLVLRIQEERGRQISYNALNRLLKICLRSKHPLPQYGPKSPRIYDVAQIGSYPPTFLFTIIGEKEGIHASWMKFFERRLREKFGFHGTAIVVKFRQVPASKSLHQRNRLGPGMEEVAKPIHKQAKRVNLTQRRQKK